MFALAALKPLVAAAGVLAAVGYASVPSNAVSTTAPLTGLTAFGPSGIGGNSAVGDLAVIASGWADGADVAPGVDSAVSTGFATALATADLYQAGTRAANMAVQYKILTAGDIAAGTITFKGYATAGQRGGGAILIVMRSVSGSPIKASASAGGGATDAFNPPALTTTVANSFVFSFSLGTRAFNPGAVGTAGAGMTEATQFINSGSSRSAQIAFSWSAGNAAGTVIDQGARTGTPASAADSWVSCTIEVA